MYALEVTNRHLMESSNKIVWIFNTSLLQFF